MFWAELLSPPVEDRLAESWERNRGQDAASGQTSLGVHRSDMAVWYAGRGVPAAQCSTGEQKALLISLVLANARALKAETGSAPLVLLDEVAAHLDAGRRAALFDEICQLDAQAFMTGTGPELFTELGARALHLSVTDQGGASEARFYDEAPS